MKTNKKQNITPWTDQNGCPYSTEKLKEVSKQWNHQTWEDYLQSLEVEQSESTISQYAIDENFEEQSFGEYLRKELEMNSKDVLTVQLSKREAKKRLKMGLKSLSSRELKVIDLLIAKNKRVCEVADDLGILPQNVITFRDSAFKKLRNFFADYLKNGEVV